MPVVATYHERNSRLTGGIRRGSILTAATTFGRDSQHANHYIISTVMDRARWGIEAHRFDAGIDLCGEYPTSIFT